MESVRDMLSDPLKGTKRAQDILCYLFREVLLWRKINQRTWNRRQEIFFEKPHNSNFQDRGNLNKLLKSDTMQWLAFKKAMDFLNPVKCTLELKLNWLEGDVSSYVIIIDPEEDDAVLTTNSFPWEECTIFNNIEPSQTLMSHFLRHIIYMEGKKSGKDIEAWWDELFLNYEKNPVNVIGLKKKEIVQNTNTLKRALIDHRLTWNNLRRGIHLLNPVSEEYILTLQWTDDPLLRKSLPDSVHAIPIIDPYKTKGNKL